MYHWFFLLEITVVKIMNNLNVFSAHTTPRPGLRRTFLQSIDVVFLEKKVFFHTKLSVLLKIIFFHQSKNYKNQFKNSNFCGMWPFRSHWSCDIQFHKYAVHINGDFCLSFF
jgi:inhibitor of KinA sporulation pathway (predicted exonuclease)